MCLLLLNDCLSLSCCSSLPRFSHPLLTSLVAPACISYSSPFLSCHSCTCNTALEYVSRVKVVASKIEALGEKVSEAMLMAKILNDLPPEYEMLKEAWEETAISRGAALKLEDSSGALGVHES